MRSVVGAKVAQARRKGNFYFALDGRFTYKGYATTLICQFSALWPRCAAAKTMFELTAWAMIVVTLHQSVEFGWRRQQLHSPLLVFFWVRCIVTTGVSFLGAFFENMFSIQLIQLTDMALLEAFPPHMIWVDLERQWLGAGARGASVISEWRHLHMQVQVQYRSEGTCTCLQKKVSSCAQLCCRPVLWWIILVCN